ncbi:MAG TPA: pyrroline-5-carboxylate reductase [Acidimicrobiales bacterium]|nr:pyrroline-5-carboxylate reductase [Acidimicrobiales bacterium]
MAPDLVIVGGGRMGEALLSGLISAQWTDPARLAVVEPVAARRKDLASRYTEVDFAEEVPAVTDAVIVVKPNDVEAACEALAKAGTRRCLSVAAGVRIESLEEWLGPGVAVVRAMPNTPALIGSGAAAIAGGSTAQDVDLDWAEGILSAVGVVQRVTEPLLDAVTGLSGSGPAYLFLMAEALVDAGVLNGLSRSVSKALVLQTLLGSARLLVETGDDPEELRAAVTSPGGTTAAALRVLESRAVRSALLEAVTAATERSRQLGQR